MNMFKKETSSHSDKCVQYAYLIPGEAGKEDTPAVRSAGQPHRFGDNPVR